MNVLITGGAGFIGSNFIRWVLTNGRESAGGDLTGPNLVELEKSGRQVRVVNLDALTYAGRLENLEGLPEGARERHLFVKGDIRDRELVDVLLREHKIDTIVHFAAETHVDRSLVGPDPFIETNVLGTLCLAEAAWRYWIKEKGAGEGAVGRAEARFHHISTDEVYGMLGPDEAPWTESAPYAPTSPYSRSKAASDHIVRAFGKEHGLPYSITNCSNNYGPRQFPEKLVPLVIANALEGKELPVYGDGKQVRDWIYVEDHCEAIWRVVTEGRAGETYNVGGLSEAVGGEITNLELVEKLCALLDEARPESPHVPHRNLIRFVADRPGHDRRYAIDSSKIRRELGWRPRHSLDEGLRKTVAWYLENPGWVASIRASGDYREWIERNYAGR